METWWQSLTISIFTLNTCPSSWSCSKYCFRWSKWSGRIVFGRAYVFCAFVVCWSEGFCSRCCWKGSHLSCFCIKMMFPVANLGWLDVVLLCCCLDVLGRAKASPAIFLFSFIERKTFILVEEKQVVERLPISYFWQQDNIHLCRRKRCIQCQIRPAGAIFLLLQVDYVSISHNLNI